VVCPAHNFCLQWRQNEYVRKADIRLATKGVLRALLKGPGRPLCDRARRVRSARASRDNGSTDAMPTRSRLLNDLSPYEQNWGYDCRIDTVRFYALRMHEKAGMIKFEPAERSCRHTAGGTISR